MMKAGTPPQHLVDVHLAVTLLREALAPLPSLAPGHAGVAADLGTETAALTAALDGRLSRLTTAPAAP